MADLIGFNRLGNNVKGHYEARFLRKSRSSYLKQLQGFMISNEAEKSQSNKIRELMSDEKARKRRWNSKRTRKNLYYAHMNC